MNLNYQLENSFTLTTHAVSEYLQGHSSNKVHFKELNQFERYVIPLSIERAILPTRDLFITEVVRITPTYVLLDQTLL